MKHYKFLKFTFIVFINIVLTAYLFNVFSPAKKIIAEEIIPIYNSGTFTAVVGSVQSYSGSTTPTSYLLCNGQAVSRVTYVDLFNVIGTTYGTGNGSTTFNLPNLTGNIVVGHNSSDTDFNILGKTGGAKSITLTTNQIPGHTHAFTGNTATTSSAGSHSHTGVNTSYFYTPRGTGTSEMSGLSSGSNWNDRGITRRNTNAVSHAHTVTPAGTNTSTGSNQAHNNLQPYIVMNYIIKH